MTPTDPDTRARFGQIHFVVREPLARYLARRAPIDEVEDLFADTMVVAWRRLADIPEGAEVAWIFGVARRVLANHRRGAGRLARLVERATLAHPRVSPGLILGADPQLASAMARLSGSDAEILRLAVLEELAPREIAIALGISANAASIRLHRAKGRLRELLEPSARKSARVPGHLPVVEQKEV